MGNCQAIDAAALVLQYPDGRLQRMYWPVPASEVMRANPGHYVSVIIPLRTEAEEEEDEEEEEEGRKKKKTKKKPKTVRFTRVKLLRQTDILALGHAYRLVTSQEVMKVLRAKKNGKTQQQQRPQQQTDEVVGKVCPNNDSHHQGMRPVAAAAAATGNGRRSKSWRPSLQSIDEVVS